MLPELTSMCLGVDCTSLWNSIRGMLDFPSSVVWMIVVGYSDSDIISHVVCLLFLRMVFIHFCTLCLSIWAIGPVHIFLSLTKHWVKPVVHVGVDKSSLIIFLQIERVVCRLPHRYFWLPVCLLLAQLNWGERNVAQSRDLFKKNIYLHLWFESQLVFPVEIYLLFEKIHRPPCQQFSLEEL